MRGLAVLTVAIVAVAGCGGDDDDETNAAASTMSEPDSSIARAPDDGSTDDPAPATTAPTSETAAGTSGPNVETTTTAVAATTIATPDSTAPATPPSAPSAATTPPATSGGSSTDLATAAARAALDAMSEDVAATDSGQIDFAACPFDTDDGLLSAVFGDLGVTAVTAAIDEPTFASVYVVDADLPAQLTCDRYTDDVTDGIGIFAMQPPGDIPAFAKSFANPDGGAAMDVTVSPSGSIDGGDVYHACAVATDDPTYSYCELYWAHPDVVIGAFVAGASSVDTDLDALEAALAPEIGTILANLAT
jgi:hypothetical protein